jgi:DNA-binding XRE family transcriptional regulator
MPPRRNHNRDGLTTWLGKEVKQARRAAGFKSQDALARALGFSRTVIAKIETGERPPSPDVAAALLELFPELGKFRELSEIAREQRGTIPNWFEEWVEIERIATVLRGWEPLQVPGLLQTADYAGELLGWGPDSGGDLERSVSDRLERQKLFDRDNAPEVWFLLGEFVFSNLVGSAEIMRAQIDHLAAMAQRPHVTIQIVPASAKAYGGMSGAFAIADTPEEMAAYLETGIQGMVVRDFKLVARAQSMFDYLRSDSDPRSHTADVLARAGEQWKAQSSNLCGARHAPAAAMEATASKSVPRRPAPSQASGTRRHPSAGTWPARPTCSARSWRGLKAASWTPRTADSGPRLPSQ